VIRVKILTGLLRIGRSGRFRALYRVVEKLEHFVIRIAWQGLDQLSAPQNLQQLSSGCPCRQQLIQLLEKIGVREAAGVKGSQNLIEGGNRRGVPRRSGRAARARRMQQVSSFHDSIARREPQANVSAILIR